MNTKLSVQQIQLALYNFSPLFNKRSDTMATNISWGLLNHEADFVSMNRSGYLTEIEIKRSWADFKADFKKDHGHNDERVYRFFFCVPEEIIDKVKDFIIDKFPENSDRPAVLYYDEQGCIGICDIGTPFRKNGRKLFIEEQLQFAKLSAKRFWKVLNENIK